MSNNESDNTHETDTDGESEDNKTLDELEGVLKKPSLEELSIDARGNPDEYPRIKSLARDVSRHGEAHVTVEEHDDELEVRVGTCYFNFETGLLDIRTPAGHGTLKVSMDSVVSWEQPYEAWH